MVRASPNLNAFDACEFAPVLEGRTDLTRYNAGCGYWRTSCRWSSPAVRRPGNAFVASTRFPDKRAVLLSFPVFDRAGLLPGVRRPVCAVYRNDGPLLESSKSISGADASQSVVLTITGPRLCERRRHRGDGRRWDDATERVADSASPQDDQHVELNDMHTSVNTIDARLFPLRVRRHGLAGLHADHPLSGTGPDRSQGRAVVDTLTSHSGVCAAQAAALWRDNWVLSQIDFLDGPYLRPIPAGDADAGGRVGASISLSSTNLDRHYRDGEQHARRDPRHRDQSRLEERRQNRHRWRQRSANANSTWTVTRVSANAFDLNGSVFDANVRVDGEAAYL